MAIFGLSKEWFENLSVETRPKRHYRSASLNSSQESGITGSIHIFAERSKFEKEAQTLKAFDDSDSFFGDDTLEGYRESIIASASANPPTQTKQVTTITLQTEDTKYTLRGKAGVSGSFDYRNLLGHPSYDYVEYAYFDLFETSGTPRRFYFHNSSLGDSLKKPLSPINGTKHIIDLKSLVSIGDPTLSPNKYDVAKAIELISNLTTAAINTVPAFSASYSATATAAKIEITNSNYGLCQSPITGTILNKATGKPKLDLDINADGVGDQVFPTFPYNIFNISVTTPGESTSISDMMNKFLGMINSCDVSSRKQTTVGITRFEPSFKLTSDTLRKNVIKDILIPHYRTKYPGLHWGFTNYNTLNFFTSSAVPEDTALIYPAFTDETVTPSKIPYSPSGSFTFEFYINPRYTTDVVDSYASCSFVVSDWESLFIDFHGGGRGSHENNPDADYLYSGVGLAGWCSAIEAEYTGFYDSSNLARPNVEGPAGETTVAWTEEEWYLFRGYTRHENLVTDKGDEAPDYDFRSGDPIVKNCSIKLNDGNGSGVQTFSFVGPGSIHNASDWTVGKNEVGDYDNYETAKNIAKVIDNNQYFKSWAERVEIVDEDGQQKVNEAGELLWTDDNGLNEYSLTEALAKDGKSSINDYQATDGTNLLWKDSDGNVFAAKSKGYGARVRWHSGSTYNTAANFGYTGWYNVETFEDVDGPVDSLGKQRWVDIISGNLEAYDIATGYGYTGFYNSADPTRPNVSGPASGDIVAWSEAEWAAFREYRKFPITYSAAAWSEEAWADKNDYDPAYLTEESGTIPGNLTLTLPAESDWMEDSGYDPAYANYADEQAWAAGQGYKAVMVYEPTKVYGRVWIQTEIPGWDGNTATATIKTVEQTEFSWYSWEETAPDVWEWVENTESTDVSEDAKSAFRDTNNNELEWSSGPNYVASPIFSGGRNHVITDREKSHPFHAGTILHMSSSYAISLVTGSHIDAEGHPDKYRILLQLSSSAEIPPSEIDLDANYVNEKIYLTSDNSLNRNEWHHVAIRWGTELVDGGKAQILINGVIDTEFTLTNFSIPQEFGDVVPIKWSGLTDLGESSSSYSLTDIVADPSALFVGNFFEGKNAAAYKQTTVYLDGDGNPTLKGNHVSEKYGWYVQEKDGSAGRWIGTNGVEVLAADVGTNDATLRATYFAAAKNQTLDQLSYSPILSATLAFDIVDLITVFSSTYVYNQVLEIDSDSTQYIQGFFSYERSEKDGVIWGRLDDVDADAGWTSLDPDPLEPNDYELRHPLNAEIHEIKIWNEYRNIAQLSASMNQGIESIVDNSKLMFYLPPFFIKESRQRDVMLTPFQTARMQTDDPFNVAMSFGVGGHLLNLENFCRDLITNEYPILLNLSGSIIDETASEPKEANDYLFENPQVRKRNLTILPCDNGLFVPDFDVLSSGTYSDKPTEDSSMSRFVNDHGTLDLSFVTLRNMISPEVLYPGLIAISKDGTDDTSKDSIFAQIAGSTPEDPGVAHGSVLAILQRTRDTSSNEIVFFDVSNLFYGKKINPKSFVLTDHDVTGSGGKVKITLRDNGRGTLYRADANSKNATWASVGNLMYEEGIATVLNPCIPYFGKEQFAVEMEGVHNIHIMEIMIPCSAGTVNSSSNPNFQSLNASSMASDQDTGFVYITGLNFHDENLNVVARTNLAQPVTKRDSDSITFRVKIDF